MIWYLLPTAILLGWGIFALYGNLHHRRLRKERRAGTLETFQREFEGTNYTNEAIIAAYEDLTKDRGHHVRRTDSLEKTLGFLPEDFEDIVEERCRKFGIQSIDRKFHGKMFSLSTVDDYVAFLSFAKTNKGANNSVRFT